MRTTTTPRAVWAHAGGAIAGAGGVVRFDPGTGPGRYQRALEALLESGRGLAFASFTFDPDEGGSVVEIPETTEDLGRSYEHVAGPGSGRVVHDGVPEWKSGIVGALDAIDSDIVEKVVLTRQVDLEFDSGLPVSDLIDRLRDSEPDSYTFHVAGLVGASPELLVSLRDGKVSSLALAGTASEAEWLATEKMDREHELSRSSVEDGIAPHVETLTIEKRTVRGFGQIKHLATKFEGTVVPGATVLDVLGSLHPTAAVAGAPTDTSLKIIEDLEPRSRGRYAGPVGWFDTRGQGEFAIALRCGLIEGSLVTLYAGGGIVRGSDIDSELRETELKLQPMLGALGLLRVG